MMMGTLAITGVGIYHLGAGFAGFWSPSWAGSEVGRLVGWLVGWLSCASAPQPREASRKIVITPLRMGAPKS